MNDPAFEIEYAPDGVDSGLCLGLASTAVSGEGVSLQECGTTSRVVWIQDTFSSDYSAAPVSTASPSGSGECGLGLGCWAAINGSDTDFSQPFVLTYPANALPDRQAAGAAAGREPAAVQPGSPGR